MWILSFILSGCSEDQVPEEKPVDPWEECFIAGTQITMEDGDSLSIEEIKAGDYVRSMQVDSGLLTVKPVLSVMQGSANTLYSFFINNLNNLNNLKGSKLIFKKCI